MIILAFTSATFFAMAEPRYLESGYRASPIDIAVSYDSVKLTSEQVQHYIGVKQALRKYWQAPEHASLLKIAKATERHPVILYPDGRYEDSLVARVYDYPQLVTKDTALAALFVANHFAPADFEGVQVAVHEAMMMIVAREWDTEDSPSAGPIVDQNVACIFPYRKALEAVGVIPYSEDPVVLRDGATGRIGLKGPKGMLFVNMMEP